MHKSSDIPNFDTYPATPSDELADYKGVERYAIDSVSTDRASIYRSGIQSSSLEQRAAELGAAAGRIALIMKQTRDNLENLAHHSVYERLAGLAENAIQRSERLRRVAAAKVQSFTHSAQDKAADLGRQTREKTAELGRSARANYYRARLKANQTVREHPVETALAAGAAGFLIGMALRIRRAKRAY
ncbi:MAG TPA: hypothetical protein VH724_15685 [Candidatus Angelobacter sp.]|nr:hypothetical protein [Candidatus Angelobacter sp.]